MKDKQNEGKRGKNKAERERNKRSVYAFSKDKSCDKGALSIV